MASKKESACHDIRETSFSLNREQCALMALVSAVEIVDNICREKLNCEQREQSKIAQEQNDGMYDEDQGEHGDAGGDRREEETNGVLEGNHEDDKGDLVSTESESSVEIMQIGNHVVIAANNQVVDMVEVEELSPDGSQLEAGAENQAVVSSVVPEIIQKNSQEKVVSVAHPITVGENEQVPSNEVHVDIPASNCQQKQNQPDQSTHEVFTTAQMTTQMINMNKKLSEIMAQLIRAEERVQLLENVLLVRRGCVHCQDKYSKNNNGRDEHRLSHRGDGPDRRSEAVEEWNDDRHVLVENRPTNAHDVSSPTNKLKEEKQERNLHETKARRGAGGSAKEEEAGLKLLRDSTARNTKVQAMTVTGVPGDDATEKMVKESMLGKRRVLDDDVGKGKPDSKEHVDGRGATKCKRVRRSVPTRRRVNWSVEDNYLFMRIVCDNRHLGETRIRRKLADTFSAHRTHEQCANHLRILRAQGRLPTAEDEPSTSNTRYNAEDCTE